MHDTKRNLARKLGPLLALQVAIDRRPGRPGALVFATVWSSLIIFAVFTPESSESPLLLANKFSLAPFAYFPPPTPLERSMTHEAEGDSALLQ